MSRENASLKKYFISLFISSIVSVVVLTIFDFGGWIIAEDGATTYYYISLFDFIPWIIVVFVIIVTFIYSTVLSLMNLDNPSSLNPLKHYKFGRNFTIISEIIIVVFLIFLIIMGLIGNSWWIGVSFYEGLSASVFNLVLYTIIIRKIKNK